MASEPIVSKRRGGRAARKALRAAPVNDAMRPIRPGMEAKGHYRILTNTEMHRIHQAALDVLEQIGISENQPSTIEYLTGVGCKLNANDRITFPRALVEDFVASANRDFLLAGRDPRHDITPRDSRVYFGTAGAAVNMVNPITGAYRETTLNDLYDCSRLADSLDNIHFFQRTVTARDIDDPFDMDFNTCYASLAGTSKHVGCSWGDVPQLKASIETLHMLAGSEKAWRERPFVSMSCCFVVTPLKWADAAVHCLEVGARAGMPILLVSLGQSGATSPAALPGTVVTILAEALAGLIYVNAVAPGNPCILGAWPFVSDLRTGAMCAGSGEQALLNAAVGQMGRSFYDLPCSNTGGISDSKIPDPQSGYEKALNHVISANSGANLIYEAGGMQAALLGFSLESLVLDNDSVGAALRTVRGLEINDDTISLEVIRDVCLNGPGHFLGHQQTLELMERDYVYPAIGDRGSPDQWRQQGATSSLERAIEQVDHTLASHYPAYIPAGIDKRIREKFPVRLAPERMRPNPRWPRKWTQSREDAS